MHADHLHPTAPTPGRRTPVRNLGSPDDSCSPNTVGRTLGVTRGFAPRSRVVALVMVVATLAALFTLASAPPANAAVTGDWTTDLANQINAFRGANGVGPVRLCPNLTTSAQSHANDMAARNYFSHTSPEGSTYISRDQGAGYTGWSALGENIAAGFPSVSAVMGGWTASPEHRANLLGGYADIGLGLAYSASGVAYWVNEFGLGGVCGTKVIGSYDNAVSGWPQTGTVTGWAFDSNSPGQVLNVDVAVDGATIGRYAANQTRNDIGAAFANAGPAHGFSITFNGAPGGHTVCVTAISLTPGITPSLGCRFVAFADASPIGSLDTVASPSAEVVHVGGWTFDPETTNALDVHIYVDNILTKIVAANTSRPDIGTAYPGYGSLHGFDTTLSVLGGTHSVCVYAINQFLGINPLLGCRAVTVTNGSPIGTLDAVDLNGPRAINVRGWTLDLEQTGSIDLDIYVDGTKAGRYLANQTRTDVSAAYPGYGSAHGYVVALTVAPGTHTVCTYGINVGIVGANATLGCKTVTIPGNPIGSFDTLAGSNGTLRVGGWALDPDTAASIDVHVYVDGTKAAVVTANGSRTDIGAAFAFFGALHGFSASVSGIAAGNHQVCTYGINSGVGVNSLIACRSILTT